MAVVAIFKSVCWIAVAAIHFFGRTLGSVEKLVDSAKSNAAVCVDYFKNPKPNVKDKSDGDKVDSKVQPVGSTDKTSVSGRGSAKEVGRLEVSKAACTAVNDVVDVSSKLLFDVYLTGLGLVQNDDGTMWYWPWCVFHDKCHQEKGDKLKALAEEIEKLQEMGIIKNETFVDEKFKEVWPEEVE